MTDLKVLIVSTVLLICNVLISFAFERSPDIDLTIMERIRKAGYPAENHTVITEDNYILTTFRIPHGLNATKPNRNPILIFHGLGGTSENFITLGKDAVAYYLANRGYDIWLANARGNFHSRKHVTLNPDTDKEYWNYSYHEIATYDIPANVEYILNKTKETSVYYIGHSQGSTLFFVLLAERPEYNDKIRLGVVFGPTAEFRYKKAPLIVIISSMHRLIERLFRQWNLYELVPNGTDLFAASKELCSESKGWREVCSYVIMFVSGTDSGLFNKELAPLIISTGPAGASTKNAVHYFQCLDSGYFRQYDYGVAGNLKHYNSTTPPLYNLDNVKAPTALFYSALDWFAPREAVEKLAKKLPNVVKVYEVPLLGFSHIDYIFSNTAVNLIYKPLNGLLGKYKDEW